MIKLKVILRDILKRCLNEKIKTTIKITPQHRYQILTKRASRMYDFFSSRVIPANVWLGVTVESKINTERVDYLRMLNASVKFLSYEPLLENLGQLNLSGIDWVIVGGESGNRARPMKPEWVDSIYLQCQKQNSLFFFKQWGTWGNDGVKRSKSENGKLFGGKIIQQIPAFA